MHSIPALRQTYTKLLLKYKKIKKGSVRLTQSSLLLIQPINPATDTYKFPLLESDNAIPPQPEELRLNINDEFISYDIGYYLMCAMTHGTAPIVNDGKMYMTYAPIELDLTFATLERAWDGYLQVLVNKISRLEKWDLKKHQTVTRTQFQSSSTGIPAVLRPSIDYTKDGRSTLTPMLVLSGAKKNDIIITLTNGAIPNTSSGLWTIRSADATAVETVTGTELALFFRGLLAQNASQFQ